MKKTLLAVVATLLVASANAQEFKSQRVIGTLEKANVAVKAAPSLRKAPKKADLASNQRLIGLYTTDSIAEYGLGIPSYAGSNRAAILLTPDMLAPYAGSTVKSIRFALCSAIGKSRVFITPIKNDYILDDAASQDVATTTTGWNNVELSSPYTITGQDTLLVGFDYTQKNTTMSYGGQQRYTDDCYPLSAVKTGTTGNGLWVYCNISTSAGGSGLGWYGFSADDANLSVQMIAEGNFSKYNVIPQDFSKVSTPAGKDADVTVQFYNLSEDPVSSIDYVVTVDGVEGQTQHADFATPVATGSYGSFTFKVAAGDEDAEKSVSVKITKVNGNDNTSADKVANGKVGVAKNKYSRNAVVEEFTTERCPNCPRVANYLHTALETADLTKTYAVCHHSAYYTDWLTKDCDNALVELFNDGGYGFAPALMFNRRPYFDTTYGTSGDKDNVVLPGSAQEITNYINYELQQLSDVQLTINAVPNADTTQVTLTINGTCNGAFDKANGLLTVYMTEDNITARSQSGATGTFIHQHVIRYFNSNWGDAITWDGNEFTKTYTIDVDKTWKKNDLKFVAFVNKHNASDVLDNAIENSIGTSLVSSTTGINNINANGDNTNVQVVARYNEAGQRIAQAQRGLNILKLANGKTVKVILK